MDLVEAAAVDQADRVIKVVIEEQAAVAAVAAKVILAVLVVIVVDLNMVQHMEVLET